MARRTILVLVEWWLEATTNIFQPEHLDEVLFKKHTANPNQNLQKSAVEEVLEAKKYPELKNNHLVVITNYRGFSEQAIELAAKNLSSLYQRSLAYGQITLYSSSILIIIR